MPRTEARMLLEFGCDDAAACDGAAGRLAGELCALAVPPLDAGAVGGGLDDAAGAYDVCLALPMPESEARCENEKVGTAPPVAPPGRPTGAAAAAAAARVLAPDDALGPTHVGAAAGGGEGARRGSSSSSSELNRGASSRASFAGAPRGGATGARGRRRAKSRSLSSSSDSVKSALVSLSSSESTPIEASASRCPLRVGADFPRRRLFGISKTRRADHAPRWP